MKCNDFKPLIEDMKDHSIDKEHYSFIYNGIKFDVILSIVAKGYEILIAIHTRNWGCVLEMNKYYWIEIPNKIYNELCTILQLTWNENHFSSPDFLRLLSENAPNHSNLKGVDYRELRDYTQYRQVDEAEKIYFCGWNDHTKDNRKAHNFDKTEFYFGKTVADYCRANNISSRWTDVPKEEIQYKNPF